MNLKYSIGVTRFINRANDFIEDLRIVGIISMSQENSIRKGLGDIYANINYNNTGNTMSYEEFKEENKKIIDRWLKGVPSYTLKDFAESLKEPIRKYLLKFDSKAKEKKRIKCSTSAETRGEEAIKNYLLNEVSKGLVFMEFLDEVIGAENESDITYAIKYLTGE